MQYTDRQAQAIASSHPKILVIAGAGTGKTRVLTERIARLLDERVPPERILAVTFTRKAASEMADRLEKTVGPIGRRVEMRTMHSWAARLCRAYADTSIVRRSPQFTIWDGRDREDVVRGAARDVGIHTWGNAKIARLLQDERVAETYEDRKRSANALDYDDLEGLALRLITEHEPASREWTQRYRHVLVDEYQDTNLAQVTIFNGLTPPNFFVVGDPRQSIYRFRGAEVQTILDCAADNDYEVIQLTTNFRSRPHIVRFANGAVNGPWEPMEASRPAPSPVPSGRETYPGETAVVVRHWEDEPMRVAQAIADAVESGRFAYGHVAVLARRWSEVSAVVRELGALGVPAVNCGPKEDPWESAEGRAVARAALLAANPYDDEIAALLANWGSEGDDRFDDLRRQRILAVSNRWSLARSLASASTAWAGLAVEWLTEDQSAGWYAEAVADSLGVWDRLQTQGLTSRISALRYCIEEARQYTPDGFRDWWTDRSVTERVQGPEEADSVQCMTIHASKGLEFPAVAFVGARDGAFPSYRDDDDDAEALRLFYVASTRAEDLLLVSSPQTYRRAWERFDRDAAPSPFTQRCQS